MQCAKSKQQFFVKPSQYTSRLGQLLINYWGCRVRCSRLGDIRLCGQLFGCTAKVSFPFGSAIGNIVFMEPISLELVQVHVPSSLNMICIPSLLNFLGINLTGQRKNGHPGYCELWLLMWSWDQLIVAQFVVSVCSYWKSSRKFENEM